MFSIGEVFLITRPDYEATTHVLFVGTKKILKKSRELGVKTVSLDKNKANLVNFNKAMEDKRVGLINFNGHGQANLIVGQDDQLLVEVGFNEKILAGKIIYCLACQAGKKLGPAAVQAGTKAFMGYDEDFIFLEQMADWFLPPSNCLVEALLTGKSSGEAYELSQQAFQQNIQALLTSEAKRSYAVPYLVWDKKHQVCLGDKQARFR